MLAESCYNSIESGLDFILSHFPNQRYPRTISTKKTQNSQVKVYSKEDVLIYFKQANFIDCRINAYPSNTIFKEIQRYPPDFIFIDLDRVIFNSERALNLALYKTLQTIKNKLNGYPTVLFTGGGYHIYQPIEGIILENYKEFNQFCHMDLFKKFLRFSKDFLSNGKADKNNYPSLESCLLRVPGSINSKYNTEVKIIQKWNGYRPHIRLLLGNYLAYLVDLKLKETKFETMYYNPNGCNSIQWIEKLLQTPIEDSRKYCLWRILCPYLVNVKKLSFDEAIIILKKWLNECDKKRRLNFKPTSQINTNLRNAREWYPLSLEKLKQENKELYQLIK